MYLLLCVKSLAVFEESLSLYGVREKELEVPKRGTRFLRDKGADPVLQIN